MSDHDLQACIDNCIDCHRVCAETMTHCLQEGGRHTNPDHLHMMLDCAQICQTAADFMLRGSSFHTRTCAVCAEVCVRCAEDCDQFAGDEHMLACADMCRRCAESCQHMAGATV